MLYNCLCTTGRYLDCNGTCLWNNVPLCSGKWKAKGLGICGKLLSTYLVTLRNTMSLPGRWVHDTCGFCSTPRWTVLLTQICTPENSLKFFVSRQDIDLLPTSSTRAIDPQNIWSWQCGRKPHHLCCLLPTSLSTAHQVWTKFRLFHNIVKTRRCFFKDFSYAAV